MKIFKKFLALILMISSVSILTGCDDKVVNIDGNRYVFIDEVYEYNDGIETGEKYILLFLSLSWQTINERGISYETFIILFCFSFLLRKSLVLFDTVAVSRSKIPIMFSFLTLYL